MKMMFEQIANLNAALCRDDAIDWTFRKGIKTSVGAAHEVWFQKITRRSIVLEFPLVQLHR